VTLGAGGRICQSGGFVTVRQPTGHMLIVVDIER
jgi:hypothetical protein